MKKAYIFLIIMTIILIVFFSIKFLNKEKVIDCKKDKEVETLSYSPDIVNAIQLSQL